MAIFSGSTVIEAPLTEKELLVSSVAGAAVFPTVLGLSQLAVFKPLGISVGTRPVIPSILGGVSVCVAGCVASLAAVKSCVISQRVLSANAMDGAEIRPRNKVTFSLPELLISTVSSVVIFRGLGGRFTSVLPSSFLHPGAFARDAIPAWRGPKPATCMEKEAVQLLGKKYGCHSCGRWFRVSKYFADHQPPSKLLKPDAMYGLDEPSLVQKFYPHCSKCSSRQGVSIANQQNGIVTHPFSLRLYHLFMPVPFAIAYLKSAANEAVNLAKLSSSDSSEIETKQVEVAAKTQTETKDEKRSSFRGIFSTYDSEISELVHTFPLFIIWKKIVGFLAMFRNPGDAFHLTLWAFTAIAALGSA